MKVVRNTADTLVLEHRPVLPGLGLILFVLILVGVGLRILAAGEMINGLLELAGAVLVGGLAFWGHVKRNQVWVDALGGQVAIRQRDVTGYSQTTVPLSDLKEAIVQRCPDRKNQHGRRAALRCGGKTNRVIPLTPVYASGAGPGDAARSINDWLAARRADVPPGPPPGRDGLTRPARQD